MENNQTALVHVGGLSTQGMILEREHPLGIEQEKLPEDMRNDDFKGTQRIYRWGRYGLSAIDPPVMHSFPFAWEFAVIRFRGKEPLVFDLVYFSTLSEDVVVTYSIQQANEFRDLAEKYLSKWWVQMWLDMKWRWERCRKAFRTQLWLRSSRNT